MQWQGQEVILRRISRLTYRSLKRDVVALLVLSCLLLSSFAAIAETDNPTNAENITRVTVPLGENGELGHVEITLGEVTPLPGETHEELGQRVAEEVQSVFKDELSDITDVQGIEDPRNSYLDPSELEEVTKRLGETLGDTSVEVDSLDVNVSKGIFKKSKSFLQETYAEFISKKDVMFSKRNLLFSVFRIFGTGGVMAGSIVINEGASIMSAMPVALTAGLISASLQITNPHYGEWAIEDPVTTRVQKKYGTTPLRRLSIDAFSIWVKWGLVLEGLFLSATEVSRLVANLGPAEFGFGNLFWGITLTTLSQGMWEIVGSHIRRNGDPEIVDKSSPEFDRHANLKADVIACLASLVYASAAGLLLVENYELSNIIFAGLGLSAWGTAGWMFRDWVKETFQFYQKRLSKSLHIGVFRGRFKSWIEENSQGKSLPSEETNIGNEPIENTLTLISKKDFNNLSEENRKVAEMFIDLGEIRIVDRGCAADLVPKRASGD